MLDLILLNLLISFVNPVDPTGQSRYPSGIKDADKAYHTDKPAMNYPIIEFNTLAFDPEYNKIPPGKYAVEFLPDVNWLIFLKSGEVVAKVPVMQVLELNEKVVIPSAKILFRKENKVFIIYRNENLEIHGYLYLPDQIQEEFIDF